MQVAAILTTSLQEPETAMIKAPDETKTQEKPNSAVSKKLERIASSSVPKGKCKSGRFWKSERDRFRSTIKSRGLKQSLQQRIKAKEEKERARQVLQVHNTTPLVLIYFNCKCVSNSILRD